MSRTKGGGAIEPPPNPRMTGTLGQNRTASNFAGRRFLVSSDHRTDLQGVYDRALERLEEIREAWMAAGQPLTSEAGRRARWSRIRWRSCFARARRMSPGLRIC
jgi:hypothetical protein